jgi:hypothetical protein
MRKRLLIIAALAAVVPVIVAGYAVASSAHSETTAASQATAAFHDLTAAHAAGYSAVVQDLAGNTCIAQEGAGAMGVHYLNPALLDGTIDATKPEALVYGPGPNGKLRLVALEYLVFQSVWDASHAAPPSLFGEEFMLTPSPNRYGIPAFYALHAWIWNPNPSGLFSPWNPRVDCG